jgi:thermitase
MRPIPLVSGALVLLTMVATLCTRSRGDDKTYIADVKGQRVMTAGRRGNLSPALLAMRDAGGVLKGSDDTGRPVIAVPPPNLNALNTSAAVRSVLKNAPRNWFPVERLKISYLQDHKLTDADLLALGLRLLEDYVPGSFLVVEPIDHRIDAALADRLAGNANVRYATAALRVKAIPPTNIVAARVATGAMAAAPTNDPLWRNLWNMRNIRADVAWKTVHDTNVVVAVIDTGVDYSHQDLTGNMWADGNGKRGYDFVESDDDPMDTNGHGTHCAGTIGAFANNRLGGVGINWKVQIMAVRWLDGGGSGEVINAIKAIDFAVEHGAKVLSNSWYWPEEDPDLEAAIKRADKKGVLFIAAAGNFAEDPDNNGGDNDVTSTTGRYPSAFPEENIISVAAIDESDNKAGFSEFGFKTVDIGAPGVSITSTIPNNKYSGDYSGTSMATPHVAGAAALTMTAQPSAKHSDVRKLLLDHARKIDALKGKVATEGTLDLSFLNPAAAGGAASAPAKR